MQVHKVLSKLPILFEKYPGIHWRNALSETQMESKAWLIQTLLEKQILDLQNVMIMGGWIGLLGNFLLNQSELKINCVRSFDIDWQSVHASDELNKELETIDWKFKASVADWDELDYDLTKYQTRRLSDQSLADCETRFDTIINTCCEHMKSFSEWIGKVPDDRLMILQSHSNSEQEGHVNTCGSLDEFSEACRLGTVLFRGQLSLKQHQRYMLIGYKGPNGSLSVG
jgi:hypothetical protein